MENHNTKAAILPVSEGDLLLKPSIAFVFPPESPDAQSCSYVPAHAISWSPSFLLCLTSGIQRAVLNLWFWYGLLWF